MMDFVQQNSSLILMLGISLGVGLIASLGGLVAVVLMPADALKRRKSSRGSGCSAGWCIARNILGWLLIVAGLAMLVIPGPGLVVLLIGLTLADFPGRDRLQDWIMSRQGIMRPVNKLRERFGQPPLAKPA